MAPWNAIFQNPPCPVVIDGLVCGATARFMFSARCVCPSGSVTHSRPPGPLKAVSLPFRYGVTDGLVPSAMPGVCGFDSRALPVPNAASRFDSGSVKFCAAWPLHGAITSEGPPAPASPGVSRHLPEFGFIRLPFHCHCCATLPLQSQTCTCVPVAVPALAMSRHRPIVRTVPSGATVHCWPTAVGSHWATRVIVPFAPSSPNSSRQPDGSVT